MRCFRLRPCAARLSNLTPFLAEQAANSGLWGGSLLVALGKILEAMRNSLVTLSPYWRVDGVQLTAVNCKPR